MAAMAAAFFVTGCGCGTTMAKMAGRRGEEVEKKQRRSSGGSDLARCN